jgi:tRNA pseudouridine65 synthase
MGAKRQSRVFILLLSLPVAVPLITYASQPLRPNGNVSPAHSLGAFLCSAKKLPESARQGCFQRRGSRSGLRLVGGALEGSENQVDNENVTVEVPHIPVVHMEERFCIISKPGGMLVHRNKEARPEDRIFLLQTLRNQLQKQVFLVNRLDRATSGLMVIAFDPEACAAAQAALASDAAEKEYVAFCRGRTPSRFECDRPLTDKFSKARTSREARTSFQTLAWVQAMITQPYIPPPGAPEGPGAPKAGDPFTRALDVSIVAAVLHTGRHHQIRRHLQSQAHHLLGDTSYGKGRINAALRDAYGLPRLCLHAARLSLPHPFSGETLAFHQPLPADLAAFLAALPGAPAPAALDAMLLDAALRPPAAAL